MSYLVSDELVAAASVLAGALSEKQRQAALDNIARAGTSDAARLLMDLFQLTPWIPHQRAIVRTLGSFRDGRTCEFLHRLALEADNLTLAREAVLALGLAERAQAQEILLHFARQEGFPFRREALHALRVAPVLVVAAEVQGLLGQTDRSSMDPLQAEDDLLDAVLLVLATHGVESISSDLVVLLRHSAGPKGGPELLHACLLAAGTLGGEQLVTAVDELDVGEGSVAAVLKESVLKLLAAKPRGTIEDFVLELESALADVPGQRRPAAAVSLALSRLAKFSKDELGLAGSLLPQTPSSRSADWLRLASCMNNGAHGGPEEQKDILAAALASKDEFLGSLVAKLLRTRLGRRGWDDVVGKLELEPLCTLAQALPDPWLVARVVETLGVAERNPSSLAKPHCIGLINALVSQIQMTSEDTLLHQAMDLLGRLAASARVEAGVRGRAIRAMGQIGFLQRISRDLHRSIVEDLRQILKSSSHQGPFVSSVVHALGHLPSEQSLAVLLEHLQELLNHRADVVPVELTLVTLVHFPRKLVSGCEIPIDPETMLDPAIARLCLRLLGLGVQLAGDSSNARRWLVIEALGSSDFSDVLLGLHASQVLSNPKDWEQVVRLADHENVAISSLALEQVCRSRRASAQNEVLRLFGSKSTLGRDLVLHCLDVFEVDAQDPPVRFAEFLLSACRNSSGLEPGPFADTDVRMKGLSLAEQILLLRQMGQSNEDSLKSAAVLAGAEKATNPEELSVSDLDRIDRRLRKDLPIFDRYSETLRTVLRNAELPFSHPEIFKDSIDKSTAIIEFVKSIDLLLQERIGEALFVASRPEVLAKLQSRVACLGLHHSAGDNARLMRLLGVDHIFTPELFPSIKLTRLVQSVMAGRFVSEQLRILDGLKGWAIFLVVFGRSFERSSNHLPPVLPIAPQQDSRVARLAWDMILLQERRNIAAHRGTIVDGAEIAELRAQSVSVLATIDDLCPPMVRKRAG
jgi:hypothetical protein